MNDMNELTYLEDLLSEKKFQRAKVVQQLSILQVEMKDIQRRIDSYLVEKRLIDYQMNLFEKEREEIKNAN